MKVVVTTLLATSFVLLACSSPARPQRQSPEKGSVHGGLQITTPAEPLWDIREGDPANAPESCAKKNRISLDDPDELPTVLARLALLMISRHAIAKGEGLISSSSFFVPNPVRQDEMTYFVAPARFGFGTESGRFRVVSDPAIAYASAVQNRQPVHVMHFEHVAHAGEDVIWFRYRVELISGTHAPFYRSRRALDLFSYCAVVEPGAITLYLGDYAYPSNCRGSACPESFE